LFLGESPDVIEPLGGLGGERRCEVLWEVKLIPIPVRGKFTQRAFQCLDGRHDRKLTVWAEVVGCFFLGS
jgi:hypothetical protein